jgi:23S rRNA pseudouridine2604 synthase
MPRITRIRNFVARYFGISNEEADLLIGQGKILVDGKPTAPSVKVEYWQEIRCEEKVLREAHRFTYLKCYKPRGIECTHHPSIADNLLSAFPFAQHLHVVGRLDKDSEGLLLLTDDGRVFTKIGHSDANEEKEYYVCVNKMIDADFVRQMSDGVKIFGEMTKPANVLVIAGDPFAFHITLTQGLNRQIRRMCHKLDYKVQLLKRIRIQAILLGNLQPGEYASLSAEEIAAILK